MSAKDVVILRTIYLSHGLLPKTVPFKQLTMLLREISWFSRPTTERGAMSPSARPVGAT